MVSVIIPTFNREATIKRSLMSIINQTYSDIEIIIIDDGSTDHTKDIVKSIKDPRIKYFYQNNQGACAARNLGIGFSKGEFIAFQDSDDYWMPNKLEQQMKVLKDNEKIDIVCCQAKCIRQDGSFFISLEKTPEGIIKKSLGPYGITTQVLLMRREVVQRIQFDTNVTRYQDLDFMLMANKLYTTYCISEVLVYRYIGNDSISCFPERTLDMAKYFAKKHSYEMNNSYLGRFFASVLLEASDEMPKDEATKYKKQALKLDHSIHTLIKYSMVSLHVYPLYIKMIRILDHRT